MTAAKPEQGAEGLREQIKEVLRELLESHNVGAFDDDDYREDVDAIMRLFQAEVAVAELRVAEWFDNGVPKGFTVETWLTVLRAHPPQQPPTEVGSDGAA